MGFQMTFVMSTLDESENRNSSIANDLNSVLSTGV